MKVLIRKKKLTIRNNNNRYHKLITIPLPIRLTRLHRLPPPIATVTTAVPTVPMTIPDLEDPKIIVARRFPRHPDNSRPVIVPTMVVVRSRKPTEKRRHPTIIGEVVLVLATIIRVPTSMGVVEVR